MRTLPRCCGSEDGEIVYGIDPAYDGPETMVVMWCCNTCGVMTLVDIVTMW